MSLLPRRRSFFYAKPSDLPAGNLVWPGFFGRPERAARQAEETAAGDAADICGRANGRSVSKGHDLRPRLAQIVARPMSSAQVIG
jgi:hypothetical protein